MAEEDGGGPTQEESMTVEQMIEVSIGEMKFAQIWQAILASIPPFFDNQQTFISVFTDAQPTWHCTNHTTCNSTSDICHHLSHTDWAWDGNYNKHSTIISDWDLQCGTSFIKGLPATSFFLGCLLGGFVLATLGDSKLGRKNLIFISSMIMSTSALASAFSPNLWIYSVLRFISGFGRASITVAAFVLLSERVGKRWRGQVVLIGFVSLSLGLLSLTAIAYLTQGSSWRTMCLWTSIPSIIASILVHSFLYESPRWLLMQGRDTDSIDVLKKIGSIHRIRSTTVIKQEMIPEVINPYYSVMILIQKKWAVQRMVASMVISFGVGMMYFGMLLGVGGFGLNVYLNMTFNALLSLSSSLLTYLFWIQTFNRRTSLLGFCTISGVSSISTVILLGHDHHRGIQIGLELVSLFCATMVFNILFMYVVEMFPTCVRNSATALVRQSLLFASVFVPVLVVIGRSNKDFLSHLVFGVAILLSGILVVWLPETRGKALCDTMEEQELKDRDGRSSSL